MRGEEGFQPPIAYRFENLTEAKQLLKDEGIEED